jgi:hypothetical protein
VEKVNMYKYKLKEVERYSSPRKFHQERMLGFDEIEDLLGQIQPLLKDAKQKTEEYYQNNPLSYAVIIPTDIIQDYLKDIITALKPKEE